MAGCNRCKTCECKASKNLLDSRYKCPMDDCEGFMVELRTMEKRVCSHCYVELDWKLKKGQKPLIQYQR